MQGPGMMVDKRRSVPELRDRFQYIADRGINMARRVHPEEAAKVVDIIDFYMEEYYNG